MMTNIRYTTVTFSPIQGFIEKSRKLRDLYGGSFILSYLARTLCDRAKAQNRTVISPAIINVVQGTPNQIIIEGDFPKAEAQGTFDEAWKTIVFTCQEWLETNLSPPNTHQYRWRQNWEAWANHAWEFFWAQGRSIGEARHALNEAKRCRAWTGINWMGESSTLSGMDAIAHPTMDQFHPQHSSYAEEAQKIKQFYQQLSDKISTSIIDPTEQLSIPELIKRLITLHPIASRLKLSETELPEVELPPSFRDLNRFEENRWTGWFQGDGDRIGEYLKTLNEKGEAEAKILQQFSQAMLDWGKEALKPSVKANLGRVIYAGGDDFLGVFYQDYNGNAEKQTLLNTCLEWFYRFKGEVWQQHEQDITVSVGFVWAGGGVPQRDVLQHCREAEQAAKKGGRDRLAIRVLFNSGNYLEWTCPWWFLETVLTSYRDRSGNQNWTHIYNDIAALEARHAFSDNSEVALGLFSIYFGEANCQHLQQNLWTTPEHSGILGSVPSNVANPQQALNQWIINLAKVGFHLCQ
ncbi:MAG: Cas10/Cmr2 second palm domain-containing protein [Halothece sp.]